MSLKKFGKSIQISKAKKNLGIVTLKQEKTEQREKKLKTELKDMPNIAKPRVLRKNTLSTVILGLAISLGKTIMI